MGAGMQPITIISGDKEIDIHRKSLKLTGNAHDINRVAQACLYTLKFIEHDLRDTGRMVTVYVQEPQEDED